MIKSFLALIAIFIVTVIQLSLVPNLAIFGGVANLSLILISYFYYHSSNREQRFNKLILLAIMCGLFLDLLSGGRFASAIISLTIITISYELLTAITSIEPKSNIIYIIIFIHSLIFDLIYLSLNQSLSVHLYYLLTTASNAFLTLFVFWFINQILIRLNSRKNLLQIKLME